MLCVQLMYLSTEKKNNKNIYIFQQMQMFHLAFVFTWKYMPSKTYPTKTTKICQFQRQKKKKPETENNNIEDTSVLNIPEY